MSDERKNAWFDHLALTAVLLAVFAAVSAYERDDLSTRVVLAQAQTANGWAYYQSKSLKGYLYELQKERLEFELALRSARASPEAHALYMAKIRYSDERIREFDADKAALLAQARQRDAQRVELQHRGRSFGVASVFLQVAILLCAVSALLRRRAFWLAGSALGAAGFLFFLNGYLSIF
ncbi:MAG: DUF4337 domain-containing protein [Elusimicrobiota bacterium]|jgi:hypothetical protein